MGWTNVCNISQLSTHTLRPRSLRLTTVAVGRQLLKVVLTISTIVFMSAGLVHVVENKFK